jgi:hypothetical protein
MEQINGPQQILHPLLGWHGAKVAVLAQFLIALMRTRRINLGRLANSFCGPTQIDSHNKRL